MINFKKTPICGQINNIEINSDVNIHFSFEALIPNSIANLNLNIDVQYDKILKDNEFKF